MPTMIYDAANRILVPHLYPRPDGEPQAIHGYVGRRWKDLEFEEQCHVRTLMLDKRLTIEGTGADRRVVRWPVAEVK